MLIAIGLVGVFLLTVGAVLALSALRQPRLLAKLHRGIFCFVFVSAGVLCVGLVRALRAFEAFASSTLVAQVRCKWVGTKEFELQYVTFRDGKPQDPKPFRLRGDQWSIEGGVVKWHPWLTALGFPSYHKPTRLRGRYAKTVEEQAAAPTAFDLDGEFDRLWWWFYQLDPFLPFVQAAYGSAAFVYVNPALLFEVYVTPSGYLIERKRPRTSSRL